jgi:hypothetical protein
MAIPNRGKRGGVRIIDMIVCIGDLICFLDAYTKNAKETLTAEDARKLSRLAELIRWRMIRIERPVRPSRLCRSPVQSFGHPPRPTVTVSKL